MKSKTGRQLALFIGQSVVLLACAVYVVFFYMTNISPDRVARAAFKPTDCFLISKKISTTGHLVQAYRSDFLISYSVGGIQYNRWVSGNGLDMSYTRHYNEENGILSQFKVGQMYTCWYDPNNPQFSMLTLRHNWLSIFPLILPVIIFLIALYYFQKSIMTFVKK